MNTPVKTARKIAPASRFVVKDEHDDGSITWVDPKTLEEITLHEDTAPTEENLFNLAKNNVVPVRPNLDSLSPATVEVLDEEEEDSPLARILTRVRSVTGGDGTLRSEVKIYRVREAKDVYCGVVSVEEYDEHGEECIRAKWGPGTYRVRVYGPSMQEGSQYGKFVRLTNQLVEIEPSLVPVASPLGGGANDSNAMLVTMFQQSQQQMLEFMREMKSGGAPDTMAQFQQFAQLMRTMGLHNQAGGQKPQDVMEVIKQAMALKKLGNEFGGGEKESSEKGETSMMDMAAQVLDIINKKQSQPQSIQHPGMPMLEAPQSFQPGPEAGAESDDMNFGQAMGMQIVLGGFVNRAKQNADIEEDAKWCADKLPEPVLDMLEMPAWLDVLCEYAGPKLAPEIRINQDWFTRLRARTIELLYEGDEEPAPALPVAPAPRKRVAK